MDWAFLAPWWRVIQAYQPAVSTHPLQHSLQSSAPYGLNVRLPPRSLPTNIDDPEFDVDQACHTLRDALELVLLLSIIDHSAFTTALREYVAADQRSTAHRVLTRYRDHAEPYHHVNLMCCRTRISSSPNYAKWSLPAVAALLVPQLFAKRSRGFWSARTQILSAIPEEDTEMRTACANMAISIGIDAGWDDLTSTTLSAMTAILHERHIALSKQPGKAHGFPFCRAEIDENVALSSHSLVTIAQLDATCMQRHGRETSFRNLRIHHGTLTPDEMAYGSLLVTLCRPIACAVWHPKDPKATNATLTALHSSPPSTRRQIQQLCLALMYSRELQSLHVEWPSADSNRLCQHNTHWLMHALFSKTARHSIQHVAFSKFDLTDTEVDELRVFMASNVSTASLLQSQQPNDLTADAPQVYVAANTVVSLHPVSLRRPRTIVLAESAWLDVAQDDEGYTKYCDVVVPAYGQCRLRREDILSQRAFESQADGHDLVTSLEISVSHWAPQVEPVCGFIRLVGRPLRTLSLVGAYTIDATFWDTVFESCPLVECVKLRQVRMRTLAHVLDAYASGRCRATKLGLERLRFAGQDQGIIEFFQALADPSTRISQTLCELSFGLNSTFHYALEDEEADAIVRMLRTNTTLRFVSLYLRNHDYEEHHVTWKPSVFVAFDNQWIPGSSDPLAMRAKCAFLSATVSASTSTTESTNPPAKTQLDSFVITLIFKMAARPIRRRVDVIY